MKIDWQTSLEPIPYPEAIRKMEERVAQIREGTAHQMVWFLEHPPLYTAGTSAQSEHLLMPSAFPVYPSGRGGQYTYHGPGQRVAYVMLDLSLRGNDLRAFVHSLEEWIIGTLTHWNIRGERRTGRVGVWVERNAHREDKIAAIGIRVRRWVSYHGIALNVHPDLSHYRGIVPCGIMQEPGRVLGVTSLTDLGLDIAMTEVDSVLKKQFLSTFGTSVTPI